jgi:hypothetical protein
MACYGERFTFTAFTQWCLLTALDIILNLKEGYNCEIHKEIGVTVVLFPSCPESSKTQYLPNKKYAYESLKLIHVCADL